MTTFKVGQRVRIKSMPETDLVVKKAGKYTCDVWDPDEKDVIERFHEELELLPVTVKYGDLVQHVRFGESAVLEFIGWHKGCMVCWQVYDTTVSTSVSGEIRRFSNAEWSMLSIGGCPIEPPAEVVTELLKRDRPECD